jgi:hypothetical protein
VAKGCGGDAGTDGEAAAAKHAPVTVSGARLLAHRIPEDTARRPARLVLTIPHVARPLGCVADDVVHRAFRELEPISARGIDERPDELRAARW